MKSIIYKIICICSVLMVGMTSCFEGLLEEKVYDFMSPTNFYKTEADAVAGVNSIYSRLVTSDYSDISFHRAALMIGEYPAECSSAQTSTVPYRLEFEKYTWSSTTLGVEQVWQFFYQVIFRANLMIEKIPAIDGNEQVLKRLEGESRFLRGLSYFYLIRLFDNIPFTTASEEEDVNLPNIGTSDAVWSQIIEDLKFAEEALPVSYTGSDVGRATRGAASSILAKAYLTMAGFPWNQTDKYALAAAKCEDVIRSGSYELLPNYADNFKEAFEHNKEYIFDAEFQSQINGSNWVNMSGIRGEDVCKFAGWSSSGGTINFYNDMLHYNSGDKRLATNIILSFKNYKTGEERVWGKDYDQTKSLVHTWKYIDPDETGSGDQESNINYHFIRYADVLLMDSEAVNNADNYSGSYDKYYGINMVRARAGMSALEMNLSKEDFNKKLIWERVVELCYEGHLWYDYKRMKCMEERVARKGITVSEKHYVFPIPENELTRNTKLEQNSLWK